MTWLIPFSFREFGVGFAAVMMLSFACVSVLQIKESNRGILSIAGLIPGILMAAGVYAVFGLIGRVIFLVVRRFS